MTLVNDAQFVAVMASALPAPVPMGFKSRQSQSVEAQTHQEAARPSLEVKGRRLMFGNQEEARSFAEQNGLQVNRLPGVNKDKAPEESMEVPGMENYVHQATVQVKHTNQGFGRLFKPSKKVEHEAFWVPETALSAETMPTHVFPGQLPPSTSVIPPDGRRKLLATHGASIAKGHPGYSGTSTPSQLDRAIPYSDPPARVLNRAYERDRMIRAKYHLYNPQG